MSDTNEALLWWALLMSLLLVGLCIRELVLDFLDFLDGYRPERKLDEATLTESTPRVKIADELINQAAEPPPEIPGTPYILFDSWMTDDGSLNRY